MANPQRKGGYRRLSRSDREFIASALSNQMSFRQMAKELNVSASTVSREVKTNSFVCRKFHGTVPVDMSQRESDTGGPRCYQLQNKVHKFCNGCKRLKSPMCTRQRHFYDARIADSLATTRRREAREGIDLSPEEAEHIFSLIEGALSQGLSPAYIANCIPDVEVSASSIYRWVEQNEGGLCNLNLRRKVKMKKRKHKVERARKVYHDPRRLYSAFVKLLDEHKASRWEMDTVVGRLGIDDKALLTLLHKPSHFQLALLLDMNDKEHVVAALSSLDSVLGNDAMARLFELVLTDNGKEFAAEQEIADLFGEAEGTTRLFFCDPAASNQKGSCEKNHTEIRKIIPKGKTLFDEITKEDARLIMSHVNSLKRQSLGWKDPIDYFLFYFGQDAQAVIDAFGIEHIKDPILTPQLLNESHSRRGLGPVVMN